MARKSPGKTASARAGGYRADVDTTGMDEEMKKTLEIGQPSKTNIEMPPWMKSIGSTVKGMFGKKAPGRPAEPHPKPAKPPTTPAEADSIYQRYVK